MDKSYEFSTEPKVAVDFYNLVQANLWYVDPCGGDGEGHARR